MLASRVGISGFVFTSPPKPKANAALRFASFLAHLRAFYSDEQIDMWLAFLDDYVVEGDEQDLVWAFLRGQRKRPPRRMQELLAGCHRFVSSLATAFHILSDDELGPYGLMNAYWLQKFFGYKRNALGHFAKNTEVWGTADSWARTLSTSSRVVWPGADLDIENIARRQFTDQVALLERTFDAVKLFAKETRRIIPVRTSRGRVPQTEEATS